MGIFWAFQKIEDLQSSSFANAYEELERKVGAVKNVRSFYQFKYAGPFNGFEYAESLGERGRKCSVDGVCNALFYRNVQGDNMPYDLALEARPLDSFYLNAGEGLSAVSFMKRFYPKSSSFPATAQVALMNDEKKLSESEKAILKCFKKLLSPNKHEVLQAAIDTFNGGLANEIKLNSLETINNNFDYQYLFKENLLEKNIPNPTQLYLLHELQKKLENNLRTKYYALVLFDGDNMGKWLSGAFNKTKDDLEDFHEKLSKSLSRFGEKAENTLQEAKLNGQTVYTGGDDFLGFVHIFHVFDVLKKLRQDFHEMVNDKLKSFKKDEKDNMTFTAGIVIAHYKTPFSEVLKKARLIEKKAKREGDRNAFGITVLKHSGEIQEAVFKWDEKNDNAFGYSNWESLQKVVHYISIEEGEQGKGSFSNTFIQSLSTEFSKLTGISLEDIDFKIKEKTSLNEALDIEIKRLVDRSLKRYESPEQDKKYKKELTEAVQALWANAPAPRAQNFIHALHVADFITRKTANS